MMLICDGGCKSNGNNATRMDWKVYDVAKKTVMISKSVREIKENGKKLELTNNKAELCALVEAARYASWNSTIKTDSNVVLAWVKNGLSPKSKVKDREFVLRGIKAAQELIARKKLTIIKFTGDVNPADCK